MALRRRIPYHAAASDKILHLILLDLAPHKRQRS